MKKVLFNSHPQPLRWPLTFLAWSPRLILWTVLLSTLNLRPSPLFAQGTVFTYQGRLNDGANPASGIYDLRFTLYDSLTNGNAVAGPLINAATGVSNGLFTVTLDFGSGAFSGPARWLEIAVRTNGGGLFITLSARQQVTATPYAVTAGNLSGPLPSSALSGIYTGAVTLNNGANVFAGALFAGTFNGNGAGLTSLNASQLASGTVPDARLSGNLARTNQVWLVSGNAGTSPANGNFLGTTDNQPLELWVNQARVLRLEPGTNVSSAIGAPNVIGGAPNNFVDGGVFGATIAGGGALNMTGFLPGPSSNHISAIFGTIGGGRLNTVAADHGFIGGGITNTIQPFAYDSVIAGGFANTIRSNATRAVIGGGSGNTIEVDGNRSVIGGGGGNTNAEFYSVIGGGQNNLIQIYADHAFIGGGQNNSIGGSLTLPIYGTIGGGFGNTIQTNVGYGFIGGGQGNTASGNYATIPGGYSNSAVAYGFAGGIGAHANHFGAFVWSDSSDFSGFSSTASNQFLIRASGGVGINTNNPGSAALNVVGTVRATSFQGDGSGLINVGTLGNYVFAYSLAQQNVTSPNSFQDAFFNIDAQLNGWTHSVGTAQYTSTRAGLYLVQYTAEAYITDSLTLRAALNFVEIPGSQAYGNPINFGVTEPISKSFLASVNAGDVLTIQFTGNSGSDRLAGGGSGSTQPSISLTITRLQ